MFKGTFEECLDRVRQGSRDDLQKLADFTGGKSLATAAGWLYEPARRPAGDTWIRCVAFFRLQQWQVAEFDESDPLKVAIIEGIALDVVSHAVLLEQAGYKVKSGSSPLHPFVYGERKLVNSSRKLLELFFATKATALQEAREEASRRYRIDISEKNEVDNDLSVSDQLQLLLGSLEDDVIRTALLLKTAAPLIHAIFEDDTKKGAAARETLRQLVGQEAYSVLSVELNGMRSRMTYERARRGEVN